MQPIDLDARDPFWGVIVTGRPVEQLQQVLAEVIAAYREDNELPSSANTVTRTGTDAIAFYSFVRGDLPSDLADALRERGLAVALLDLDRDDPEVSIWNGSIYDTDYETSPRRLAERHGIVQPQQPDHGSRPLREAGLVVGRSLAAVRAVVGDDADLIEVARGVVVLDRGLHHFDAFETDGIETYELTHYLDSGEVSCTVTRKGYCKSFEHPPSRHGELTSIDGLTDPSAICTALGIPLPYLFPTLEWSLGGEPLETRIEVDAAELAPGVHRGRDYLDGAPVLVTFAGSGDPLARGARPHIVRGSGICDLVICERDVLVERLPVGAVPASELTAWHEGDLVELARAVACTVAQSFPMIETIRPELVFVTPTRRFAALAPRGPRFRGEELPQAAPIANAVREIAAAFAALGAPFHLMRILEGHEAPFDIVLALGDYMATFRD